MMRGPSYDDGYIGRKLSGLQSSPTFLPPSSPYGYGGYGGYSSGGGYRSSLGDYSYMEPYDYDYYLPSRGYSPAPRLPPRMPPPVYSDYDYGYGGGYGGGYGSYGGYGGLCGGYGGYSAYVPPPPPRYSRRFDYLDDDTDYTPRYRPPRYSDSLVEIEKEKLAKSSTPTALPTSHTTSNYLPGLDGEVEADSLPAPSTRSKSKAPEVTASSSLSEPQMLQDQVDKMRMRLKNLAYSLDPTGPVPEIVMPERSRRGESADIGRKYASGMELAELPRSSSRKLHLYPEDDHMKDNLRIKCLSHYKTTRSAAGYCKPKLYQPSEALSNTYTSKYPLKSTTTTASKWEEPDTVYGSSSDKKPYSKVETGSSIYTTYGYVNRSKDTVAEKVRDYYYDGDAQKTDGAEEDDSRKERRKKKKSKERDEVPAIEASSSETATDSVPAATSEVSDPASADAPPPEDELDEKERKRLEKKKRKAEREAAAKAAMEAELEALAAAELELAKLEADAMKATEAAEATPAAEAPETTPAATEPPASDAEKGSEAPAEKCELPPIPSTPQSEVLPECPIPPTPPPTETTSEDALQTTGAQQDDIVKQEAVVASEVDTEAFPGSVAQQEVEEPVQEAPEQEAPPPAVESVPQEEVVEEPPKQVKSAGAEDTFDTYEGEGELKPIGTQEPSIEEKPLQEVSEEVQTPPQQKQDDTQPKEQEPSPTEPEQLQETDAPVTEPETLIDSNIDPVSPSTEEAPVIQKTETSEPIIDSPESVEQVSEVVPTEEITTVTEETAPEAEPSTNTELSVQETPVTEEPAAQTTEVIGEPTSEPAENSTEPETEFKPLDESDSFWGEE